MARLLVVDDEPNILYSLQKRFHSEGLIVDVARSGREALESARQLRPDAVILDVRLADVSGMEVFDRLRELDPRLPVIIITAYAATETAIEAMKRGAFEYLVKPLDLHQLQEIGLAHYCILVDAVEVRLVPARTRSSSAGQPAALPRTRRTASTKAGQCSAAIFRKSRVIWK